MIRSAEFEVSPPCMPGCRKPFISAPGSGWLNSASGITSRLANRNTNIARSHRRKFPLTVMAEHQRPERHDDVWAEAEVRAGQADADELGADGQEVEQEDAADREPAPDGAD